MINHIPPLYCHYIPYDSWLLPAPINLFAELFAKAHFFLSNPSPLAIKGQSRRPQKLGVSPNASWGAATAGCLPKRAPQVEVIRISLSSWLNR